MQTQQNKRTHEFTNKNDCKTFVIQHKNRKISDTAVFQGSQELMMTIIASNCSDNRTKGFTTGNFRGIYVRDANSDLISTDANLVPKSQHQKCVGFFSIHDKAAYILGVKPIRAFKFHGKSCISCKIGAKLYLKVLTFCNSVFDLQQKCIG